MHITVGHPNAYERMCQACYHQGEDLLCARQDLQNVRGGPEGETGVGPKLGSGQGSLPLWNYIPVHQMTSRPWYSFHIDSYHLYIRHVTVTSVTLIVTNWGVQPPHTYM